MFKRSYHLIQLQIKNRWISCDRKLLQESLTSRFHGYLNQNQDFKNIKESHNNIANLCNLITFDKNPKNLQILKLIDDEYMKNFQRNEKINEMLQSMDFLTKSIPHLVVRLNFYKAALEVLINEEKLSNDSFIKLCYYIGLYKKNDPGPKYLKLILERYLEEKLNDLNKTDVAILCVVAYKASFRIKYANFHRRVINELISSDNDSFLFVAYIKHLRLNKICSDEVILKLKNMFNSENMFDYNSLIHIFPYVADNSISDKKLIQSIVEKCIKTFDKEARAKDIQKFLHSCALLNLNIDQNHLAKLEEMIAERTTQVEYKTHFDHFVNATLSLWILNFHSCELIDLLLNDERFYNEGNYDRIKLDSRMKLLRTCVEIERPEWLDKDKFTSQQPSFDETRPSPGFLVKSSLEKFMNLKLRNKNAKFVQQIQNLNIAGILVENNKGEKIHYEMLDENTCLSDRKTPNGIFQLKLRLLEKKNCNVKIVNSLSKNLFV